MAGKGMAFDQFLAAEVAKYKGIAVPRRAGLLERALRRLVKTEKIHPNPDDEFCMPEIGPNYEIITHYGEAIRDAQLKHRDATMFADRLTVEKMSPDGYMILNGHHRWAACHRQGMEKIPVRIVNVTHEEDIRTMLARSDNHKRVTLDLDEVVFRPKGDKNVEWTRHLALRPLDRKPIRIGIPALFRFLRKNGYDVWVYTQNFYSFDDVQHCFRMRLAAVTGAVTGTGRKVFSDPEGERKEVEKLFADKYSVTLHIDQNMLLKTRHGDKAFEEFPLTDTGRGWSLEIMDIVQKMKE